MNIKEFREQRGWSQAELAQKVNIRIASLCLIESGNSVPSYGLLAKFAVVFWVNLDELVWCSSATVGRESGWYWVMRPNSKITFPSQYDAGQKAFYDNGYRNDLIVLSEKIKPPGELE